MSSYVYVDNSNVWIEGRHIAAVKAGLAASLDEAQETNISAPWSYDFGKLLSFAGGEAEKIKRAVLFGSRPPKNDSLWNSAKEKGFEVKLYEDSAVGMNDLKLGRIAAYANTTTNVNAFTHNNEDANFRFFDENLMANNVAYFLPKTERGDKLTEELNDVIQEMLDDGTVAKITEKWMYSDMTKLIQK